MSLRCFVPFKSSGSFSQKGLPECQEGEPVLPCFPISGTRPGGNNRFIGVLTNNAASLATVSLLSVESADLLEMLVATYPGLPKAYLLEYLLDCLVAAENPIAREARAVRVLTDARGTISLQNTTTEQVFPVADPPDLRRYL